MKKLFFSAVALVAFNSVSMANTIDIEEKKTISNYVEIEKEMVLVDPLTDFCTNIAADYLCERDPDDLMSSKEANRIFQIALNACLDFVYFY